MLEPRVRPMLLRTEEVAEALGWSRSKVYQLLARGDIPSVKVAGSRRVKVSDLEHYVMQLGGPA